MFATGFPLADFKTEETARTPFVKLLPTYATLDSAVPTPFSPKAAREAPKEVNDAKSEIISKIDPPPPPILSIISSNSA